MQENKAIDPNRPRSRWAYLWKSPTYTPLICFQTNHPQRTPQNHWISQASQTQLIPVPTTTHQRKLLCTTHHPQPLIKKSRPNRLPTKWVRSLGRPWTRTITCDLATGIGTNQNMENLRRAALTVTNQLISFLFLTRQNECKKRSKNENFRFCVPNTELFTSRYGLTC